MPASFQAVCKAPLPATISTMPACASPAPTAGASAALLLVLALLIGRDDELLMTDPNYPCNRHFVGVQGGTTQLIATDASTRYQLSAAAVAAHWGDRTRGVLLASPANPTGTALAPNELTALCAAVKARGGFRIVDEIYLALSYDGVRRSVLSVDDDAVVVQSFSKYFGMTGWRLGWIVAPEPLVPVLETLAQHLFICASTPTQHAALACFEPDSLALFEDRRAVLKARRDYLVPALRDLGFGVPIVPDGAFYVMVDAAPLMTRFADDSALALYLLDHGVALVAASSFGGSAGFRISFAADDAVLAEAMRRMV